MKYLVFSDIHGNLEALVSFLKFIKKKRIDSFLFLGDLVGYGANPNEVIESLKKFSSITMIRGNHDKVSCELNDIESFNPIAAEAIKWTKAHLSLENISYLKRLRKGPLEVDEEIYICHGSPSNEDYYVFDDYEAREAFSVFNSKICFLGHTHFPVIFKKKDNLIETHYILENHKIIKLNRNSRYLINPGSIGQPRDRNPKLSFIIFDTLKWEVTFFRLDYDIQTAQKKIIENNLPPILARRLEYGI
ncbi:MAG: metallophosphoesterase family protein [Acidobacteriota bacterium]